MGIDMYAKLQSKPDRANPFAHLLGLPKKKATPPIPLPSAGNKSARAAGPSASTSSHRTAPTACQFAHLTADPFGLHAAADAARAARAAEATKRATDDADRELARRIVAAGKARRGEK